METELESGDVLFVKSPTTITISPSGDTAGIPLAVEFRLPMANLDKPWYNADEKFGPYNFHPEKCVDRNLESGGNTDLGEPLVASFSGIVINARDYGGDWGKIVRVLGYTASGELVCWMGAHLEEMCVEAGDIVEVGDPIGTIGTGNGRYYAHLHEQVSVGEVGAPWTFGGDGRFDFRQPDEFYREHGVDEELMRRVVEFDGR